MNDSVMQLAGSAEVDDFLATLAHRFTRERLKAMGHAHCPERALPDVLFIGLGDSGRGQMAAALVTLRSEGRVIAHSAGRSIGVQVDPAVVVVMQELSVDLWDAYAKPLSTEVLEGADVIVTMGRSVGSVEIPASSRHIDWRVGDPTGASVDERAEYARTSTGASKTFSPNSIHLRRTLTRIVSVRASESRAVHQRKPPRLRGFRLHAMHALRRARRFRVRP